MFASTSCTSYSDFLISVSPAVGALLSAIALWVASRARATSQAAQQTSAVALANSTPLAPSSSVMLPPEVVAALRKHWSTTPDQGGTFTSPGDD